MTRIARARVEGDREASAPVRPLRPQPLALVVADIAERVARLAPDRRDPERFHLEKHTLAAELRRLAADLGRAAA